MKRTAIAAICLSLLGCSGDEHGDLRQWMSKETMRTPKRIAPLPEAKKFVSIPFSAKANPFLRKQMVSLDVDANKYAPDPNRRKEPLEEYSLKDLKMTGTLTKAGKTYALIETPDGLINYAGIGNHMGRNYGKVVSVSEGEVILDERFKDDNGTWNKKSTALDLDDGSGGK